MTFSPLLLFSYYNYYFSKMFSCYLSNIFGFQPRSLVRNKRSEFDHFDNSEDDQSPQSQTLGSSTHIEQLIENNVRDHTWCFFDSNICMYKLKKLCLVRLKKIRAVQRKVGEEAEQNLFL